MVVLLVVVDGQVGNVEMLTGPMMRELRFNSSPSTAGSSRNFASGYQPASQSGSPSASTPVTF